MSRNRRRTAATADEINKLAISVAALMKILNTDYRWLVGSGYSKPHRGDGQQIGDPADLMEGLPGRIRHNLRRASEEIDDAYTALRGAQHFLTHIHTLIDARAAVADEDVALTASRGEVRAAEKTQSRRMERARQSGDYDEVVG